MTRAAWSGHAAVVRMLLGAGANVHVRNAYGGTPLGTLAHGSLNCFASGGGRAVTEIPQDGYVAAAEALIAAGADLPAHTAGSDAVVDVLRRHGVPDADT